MTAIKKIIVASLAGGVGLAVAISIIFGIFLWVENRPKPWDTKAITATYDRIDTEGDQNSLVFYYTLQNNTAHDYKFSDLSNIVVMAKLEKQKSLSGQKNDKILEPDAPIMIPAKQRLRFALHLRYPYDKKLNKDASSDEREKYRKDLEAYVRKEMTNLEGFVLFDESSRYQIELTKGW